MPRARSRGPGREKNRETTDVSCRWSSACKIYFSRKDAVENTEAGIAPDGRCMHRWPDLSTQEKTIMKRSDHRILTTHTGSLPRPDDLLAMLDEREVGKPVDRAQLDARIASAVAATVKRQAEIGIDVVSDGEMG